MTALISLMPLSTALKGMKSDPLAFAIRDASVVFPDPGGPHKISDERCLVSSIFAPGESAHNRRPELLAASRNHWVSSASRKGIRKIDPAAALKNFGLDTRTLPFRKSTPVAPNASAERTIVPAFPGS